MAKNEKNIQEIERELDMVKAGHRRMADLFPYFHDAGKALMLWGNPGIGKTDFMKAQAKILAEKAGLEFSDNPDDLNNEKKFVYTEVIAHQLDTGDTKGLIFPNADRTKAVALPLGTFPETGQGILFLDEINLAEKGVMNNLYQLFTHSYIGKYRLPKGFRVYAAGNLSTDRAYTNEIPRPLKNRMAHIHFLTPSVQEWSADYAEKHGTDHRIMGYLASRPDLLYYVPPDADDDLYGFCTPRSWVNASDVIKPVPSHAISLLIDLVGSEVGPGHGNEFGAFIEMSTKWDVPKIYKTGTLTVPDELDSMYALASGLVGYYKDSTTDQNAVTLAKLACLFPSEDTALIMSSVKAVDEKYFDRLRKSDTSVHAQMIEKCKKVVA